MQERLIDPRRWLFWWRTRYSLEAKLVALLSVVLVFAVGYVFTQRQQAELPPRTGGVPPPQQRPSPTDLDSTLRDARLFRLWALSNPGELERYEQFLEALELGLRPQQPVMVTPFGRALVEALEAAAAG